jgi:trehalose 6-phosphate synthase
LTINPYSTEAIGDAIYQALVMPISEQKRRMKRMRDIVKNYNVYRWAAEIIKAVCELP